MKIQTTVLVNDEIGIAIPKVSKTAILFISDYTICSTTHVHFRFESPVILSYSPSKIIYLDVPYKK